AARSASSVTMERESQTWEVLLSTRLPAWQIVIGKTVGSIFAFRSVPAIMAFVWCLAASFGPWRIVDGLGVALALLVQAFFFSGLGVLLSLTSKTSTRSLCLS